jgi:hypothetical protein
MTTRAELRSNLARRLVSRGVALFLTPGGHWRGFALTSLAYFRCSGPPLENIIVDSGRLLRVTEKLGGHPNGGNSLKSPQEIRTRSDAHGSINIQEGQPPSKSMV